jgi:small subunit ribosomal protein S16
MLKIRLRRMGARNAPFYRVVVSDSRRRPTGVAVEEVGYYDPTKQPATVHIDRDRVEHWVRNGAQVSHTVQRLLRSAGPAPQAGA